MAKPRSEQISVADTPYYHIYARCVRRGFLCGVDPYSGKSYEHRRQWIVDRIHHLASAFTIEIAAYAVMSNHYHLTVKLVPGEAKNWTPREIMTRWFSVYNPPKAVKKYLAGEELSTTERALIDKKLGVWHERLTDLSWFMKALNENIARRANREDECTGHFWEARFKSQALRSETALLTCMAYVDLNPIRAGQANTPETSDYTSIQERINEMSTSADNKETSTENGQTSTKLHRKPLLVFNEVKASNTIPASLKDYLQLVDLTGRIIREGKGSIPLYESPILTRLSIMTDSWLLQATEFERLHRQCARPK